MKIAFVEPHLKLYGGIRRVLELANRLKARGHDVTLYHPAGTACDWMICHAEVARHRDLLSRDHDAVLFNDPNLVDYDLVLRSRARLKAFYVLGLYNHSLLKGINPRIFLKKNQRTLVTRICLKSGFHVYCNSNWVHDWLRSEMGISTMLVPGGINTELFCPVFTGKLPDQYVVLCSGDPRQSKDSETIYEAFSLAKQQEPKLRLITYYGQKIPQARMREVYSSADVFVDAQIEGGWNNPVAEAMACKTPVVCTNIGSVRDIAFHEQTALLVPVRNSPQMAEAILRVLSDRTFADQMANRAYQLIRQYDWEYTVDALEVALHTSCAPELAQQSLGSRTETAAMLAGHRISRFAYRIRKRLHLLLNGARHTSSSSISN